MMNMKKGLIAVLFVMVGVLALAACTSEPEIVTVVETRVVESVVEVEGERVVVTEIVESVVEVTVEPEPTEVAPDEPKDLIICMAQEPPTLYTYGNSMLAQAAILHGVYENILTTLSFDYQAQGIEKVPSLSDGDAVLSSVEVAAGDKVIGADGSVIEALAEGDEVVNSDGETVAFDGTSVMMDQLTVDFTLQPMVWSDGTPVTADDSVYSFELAADPDTAASKYTIERTASYEATGELTLSWMGIAGYRDSTYFTNVWGPLPRHAWGSFTASELIEAEESSRMPLANGPFMVDEWVAGEFVRLVRNPYYYRADEGYPKVDSVTYKFIPDTNALVAQLLAGSCDIGTQDGMDVQQAPFLLEAESSGLLVPYFQTGTVYEHIDFNIDPLDSIERGGDRLVWFDDARVRQAMTMCTDRQSMVDNILFGRSEVIHTYIPSVHPLYPQEGLTEWPYDVDAANALLEEAGFVDGDGDGLREHPETGEAFVVTLGTTSGNEMRQQLTQIFKENMIDCGIEVELYYLPSGEWFADGGPLFGRFFDLGEFAWLTGVEPSCNLYTTESIPGPIEEWPAGPGGANETGWSNEDFDRYCNLAQGSLPGTTEYSENHMEAQRVFSQDVPVIPLFLRLKVAAARPEVVNFGVDPTENSELYNLYEIDLNRE